MKTNFITRLRFNEELRQHWPSKLLVAEAWLPGAESEGPWSIRAELWSPPDEHGVALASVGFLNQSVVKEFYGIGQPFLLTQGGRPVAQCTLEVNLSGGLGTDEEVDFVGDPHHSVRDAA